MKKLKGILFGLAVSITTVAVWLIVAIVFGGDVVALTNTTLRTVLLVVFRVLMGVVSTIAGVLFLKTYTKHDDKNKTLAYALASTVIAVVLCAMEFVPTMLAAGDFATVFYLDLPVGFVSAYTVWTFYVLRSLKPKKYLQFTAPPPAQPASLSQSVKKFFLTVKKKTAAAKNMLVDSGGETKCSMAFMGFGQLCYGQWAKGFAYLAVQAAALVFFVSSGAGMIAGLFTLGSVRGNAWTGVEGDNSVTMLIMGIFAVIVLVVYFALYISNVRDAYTTQKLLEKGKQPVGALAGIKDMFDGKFYKTTLFVPIVGVCVFNILPIVFMILIAFTNYGGSIVPPELVDWTGLESFKKVLSLGEFAPTFLKILAWNFVWAATSTLINYFGGLGLALLYSKKNVKGKAVWRMFPILAYAVPGFITLLGFKFMFSAGGPINQMITGAGGSTVLFFGLSSKWTARGLGLLVNAWISIPTSMLLATGILSNMNKDLYEAATIDGAGPVRQFSSITLPYVVFATTPVLITQFIGNFNNFGIFFFLRGGFISDGYFLASDTDLLINWLYRLSIDNNYYSIGAAISLIIFVITSVISLAVYMRSAAFKQEDTFK